jgi:cysteine desulfurase
MANQKIIYMDYAAATPLDKAVLKAMAPFYSDAFYNPSATYLAADQVAKKLESARSKVANRLGARPGEIVFTAGGTEANNLAISGIMSRFPGANIVASSVEHESVLAPAGQYKFRSAPVDQKGEVKLDELIKLIDDNTVLVSIMYANNEVGTIQPIREVARIIKEKRAMRKSNTPLYFHTDAAQAANYLDLHVARLGVDMMTLNGGKIYGPKQSGALYISSKLAVTPLILGGGQERGLRSGTENVAGCVGFAEALDIAQTIRMAESKRLKQLQKLFMDELIQMIPGAVINGSWHKRLPNNIHITIPGTDNERLLIQLDEAGILAAAGSACSASNEEPSHVLRAMGLSDRDAQASLRFSIGQQTTASDIKQVVTALKNFLD